MGTEHPQVTIGRPPEARRGAGHPRRVRAATARRPVRGQCARGKVAPVSDGAGDWDQTVAPAPGRRGHPRRRIRYELVTCARQGHAVVGADAARIRPGDAALARETDGVRWLRCLRCDAWVPGRPPGSPARDTVPDRADIVLPLRGRALRDRYVLRLIAFDRAVHVLVLSVLAVAIFYFAARRGALRHDFYRILADLQGGLGGPVHNTNRGILRDLRRLFAIDNTRLYLTGVVVVAYALLEAVEMVGLWLARRWAEYLTFVATTALLPLEVYELTRSLSALKTLTFVINLAIVVYLLLAKRLFGLRGGGRAEEEERVRTSGWDAIDRATPPPGAPVPAPAVSAATAADTAGAASAAPPPPAAEPLRS